MTDTKLPEVKHPDTKAPDPKAKADTKAIDPAVATPTALIQPIVDALPGALYGDMLNEIEKVITGAELPINHHQPLADLTGAVRQDILLNVPDLVGPMEELEAEESFMFQALVAMVVEFSRFPPAARAARKG